MRIDAKNIAKHCVCNVFLVKRKEKQAKRMCRENMGKYVFILQINLKYYINNADI